MEYYNLNRKDMVDTVMADMADNKGRVGNNIQIQDLEPTMLPAARPPKKPKPIPNPGLPNPNPGRTL